MERGQRHRVCVCVRKGERKKENENLFFFCFFFLFALSFSSLLVAHIHTHTHTHTYTTTTKSFLSLSFSLSLSLSLSLPPRGRRSLRITNSDGKRWRCLFLSLFRRLFPSVAISALARLTSCNGAAVRAPAPSRAGQWETSAFFSNPPYEGKVRKENKKN